MKFTCFCYRIQTWAPFNMYIPNRFFLFTPLLFYSAAKSSFLLSSRSVPMRICYYTLFPSFITLHIYLFSQQRPRITHVCHTHTYNDASERQKNPQYTDDITTWPTLSGCWLSYCVYIRETNILAGKGKAKINIIKCNIISLNSFFPLVFGCRFLL